MSPLQQVFSTRLTRLFNIPHPVMLAGMNVASGPRLAAASPTRVCGIGVIGGFRYSPKMLRKAIDDLRNQLDNKDAPFGVDLAIPQIGGGARKTNYDYTDGHLPELTEIMIEKNVSLFVCAIGVPPKVMVDKLHAAGIPVMNIVGHPKRPSIGVDIICAQGGEGGGHTGDTPFSVLIPAVVDLCKDAKSPLTGEPVVVVAAGGIADGRGLAAALSYGASGVWVGTRFVASEESGAPPLHKQLILSAGYDDMVKTLVYSGRPLHVRKTEYVRDWEDNRQQEIRDLIAKGKIPHSVEVDKHPNKSLEGHMWLMGQVAGAIKDIKPAREIVDELVTTAARSLSHARELIQPRAKL
ncbi:2-nitropropane dioxygenase [Lactifluus volemus]|nr:2-nitropropane dioxygenase [Lactifluus volemus]